MEARLLRRMCLRAWRLARRQVPPEASGAALLLPVFQLWLRATQLLVRQRGQRDLSLLGQVAQRREAHLETKRALVTARRLAIGFRMALESKTRGRYGRLWR